MKYSVIIPVYNRPNEVLELLESLVKQTFHDFEVIVVEDGSTIVCEDVVKEYENKLDVHYFMKPNSGPGRSRNYGVERSRGDYVLILDSDVVLPDGYLQAVDNELKERPCEAFGGPDRAHRDFSPTQKAINYAMTSFFTTGGIRGGKQKLDKFYPRSFNMGVRRSVYEALNGFSEMRFGEDIDFSLRLVEGRYKCCLFPTAWVWHKRRTDLCKFFRQVHNSGIARINLMKRHPGSLKLVHCLPAVFTVGVSFLLLLCVFGLLLISVGPYVMDSDEKFFRDPLALDIMSNGLSIVLWSLFLPVLFSVMVLVDSTARNRSLVVGIRSIAASYVQLLGYGSGFLRAWWQRCVCRKEEFEAFKETFYK